MKTILRVGGVLVGLAVLVLVGGWFWATSTAEARMAATYAVHDATVPLPMPLTAEELDALVAEAQAEVAEGAEVPPREAVIATLDTEAIAMARAVERGEHLVQARYACTACHGTDLSGGTMIDDPAIGTWLGPNLTLGEGSRVEDYTMRDWDRIVRHGVKPDGTASAMPSEDFVHMTDQELSDVVAYIQTFPPVDREVPAPTYGPVGTMLLALGEMPVSAEQHPDHDMVHETMPPEPSPDAEFGAHLAQVCTGCHRATLQGGPMPFGPPDWPPSANLTPHEAGLAGWSRDDFVTALREGVRPDGSEVRAPMSDIQPYAANMTDVELDALYAYVTSLEPQPTGE